jgi:hypothetical protein
MVGRRAATEGGDLVDDPVCGGHRGAAAVHGATKVVHQDVGPPAGELERVTAPKAPTGPGNDGYPSVKAQIRHSHTPFRR